MIITFSELINKICTEIPQVLNVHQINPKEINVCLLRMRRPSRQQEKKKMRVYDVNVVSDSAE